MTIQTKLHMPGMSFFAPVPKRGMSFPKFITPGIVGGDRKTGYNDSRDVLVTQSTDNVDYNKMWAEFQATITLQNAERQTIIDFLTFSVTNAVESVSQLSSAKFERSTEYGEPRGIRQAPTSFLMGYDFGWYDLAARFTWQFLADANSQQVEAIHASVLDADNQLVFTTVLEALYNNVNRTANIKNQDVNVYALYNADGTVPPAYKTNTFDGTHNHYMVSGAATIEPGDLDDLYEQLRHHGYGAENGVQQILLMNSSESKVVRTFRVANGATFDFIPATNQPQSLILEPGQQVSGSRPGPTFGGLNVVGQYGYQLIVEDDLFPAGYVANIGTGGKANLNNPVGIREHANASLRGLRLVKGPDNDYPLIDSFYNRGIGTGIRQRGGAAVMQIKATGSYVPPTQYLP
jgi:hypothetical protein